MDKGDVSRTLCGLGLLPSSVCYFYMAEALRLSLREPDRLLLVTKHVYPDVARCFDTNWKCVERGPAPRRKRCLEHGAGEVVRTRTSTLDGEAFCFRAVVSVDDLPSRGRGELKPVIGHQAPALPGLSALYVFLHR